MARDGASSPRPLAHPLPASSRDSAICWRESRIEAAAGGRTSAPPPAGGARSEARACSSRSRRQPGRLLRRRPPCEHGQVLVDTFAVGTRELLERTVLRHVIARFEPPHLSLGQPGDLRLLESLLLSKRADRLRVSPSFLTRLAFLPAPERRIGVNAERVEREVDVPFVPVNARTAVAHAKVGQESPAARARSSIDVFLTPYHRKMPVAASTIACCRAAVGGRARGLRGPGTSNTLMEVGWTHRARGTR